MSSPSSSSLLKQEKNKEELMAEILALSTLLIQKQGQFIQFFIENTGECSDTTSTTTHTTTTGTVATDKKLGKRGICSVVNEEDVESESGEPKGKIPRMEKKFEPSVDKIAEESHSIKNVSLRFDKTPDDSDDSNQKEGEQAEEEQEEDECSSDSIQEKLAHFNGPFAIHSLMKDDRENRYKNVFETDDIRVWFGTPRLDDWFDSDSADSDYPIYEKKLPRYPLIFEKASVILKRRSKDQ